MFCIYIFRDIWRVCWIWCWLFIVTMSWMKWRFQFCFVFFCWSHWCYWSCCCAHFFRCWYKGWETELLSEFPRISLNIYIYLSRLSVRSFRLQCVLHGCFGLMILHPGATILSLWYFLTFYLSNFNFLILFYFKNVVLTFASFTSFQFKMFLC